MPGEPTRRSRKTKGGDRKRPEGFVNDNDTDGNNVELAVSNTTTTRVRKTKHGSRKTPDGGNPDPVSDPALTGRVRRSKRGGRKTPAGNNNNEEPNDDYDYYDDEDYVSDGDDDTSAQPGAIAVPSGDASNRNNSEPDGIEDSHRSSTSVTDVEAEIEAEVVDAAVEAERTRRELLEELEANTPSATVVPAGGGSSNKDEDAKDESGTRRLVVLLFVALLVIVGAVVAIVASGSGGSDLPTLAPTVGTSSPTVSPSLAPTEEPTVFELWRQIGNSPNFGESLEGVADFDQFGRGMSFSYDGNIFAVGALLHDSNGFNDNGQFQIFIRRSDDDDRNHEWTQLGQNLAGVMHGDVFGKAVSLSMNGTIVACSGHGGNRDGLWGIGRVRVFQLSTNDIDDTGTAVWKQLGQAIEGPNANDGYGLSNSLSWDGTVVAVGTVVGKTIVYRLVDGNSMWEPMGKTIESNVGEKESYVSLSGDGMVLATGSWNPDQESGRIRVFEFNETSSDWAQIGQEITSNTGNRPEWGRSISLSGDGLTLAVGSPGHDKLITDEEVTRSVTDTGKVTVYLFDGSSWNQIGDELVGESEMDHFGSVVSLTADGNILAVSASLSYYGYGYAGAYQLSSDTNGTSWMPLGDLQLGAKEDDHFGYDATISGNGNFFAIGAPQFQTGVSVDHLGYVRVLESAFDNA